MAMSHLDSHDGIYWLVGALAALAATVIVMLYVRIDASFDAPEPTLPAHYQHPEGP